jgi:uncharacterized protein (TIGR02246 family)
MATAKAGNEEHVIGLERSYWDAIKKKDGRTVARLTADPCLVVGADGVRELRRDELAEMMKTMPYDLKDYGVEDGHVEVLSIKDDVAIVAYKVRSDYVTDGKPTRTEAFDASVWVRLDGKWVCALHTETPAASKPPEGTVA